MIQQTDTPLVSNSVAMPSNILFVINEALETSLTNNKDETPVREGNTAEHAVQSYAARIGALGLWVGGLMVRIFSNVVFVVLLL